MVTRITQHLKRNHKIVSEKVLKEALAKFERQSGPKVKRTATKATKTSAMSATNAKKTSASSASKKTAPFQTEGVSNMFSGWSREKQAEAS